MLLRGHSKPRRIAITRRQNTRTLSACSVLAASSSIELRLAVEQDGQIMIIASGIGIWSPLPLRWDRRTQIEVAGLTTLRVPIRASLGK